jgi:hypothetical protein
VSFATIGPIVLPAHVIHTVTVHRMQCCTSMPCLSAYVMQCCALQRLARMSQMQQQLQSVVLDNTLQKNACCAMQSHDMRNWPETLPAGYLTAPSYTQPVPMQLHTVDSDKPLRKTTHVQGSVQLHVACVYTQFKTNNHFVFYCVRTSECCRIKPSFCAQTGMGVQLSAHCPAARACPH